MGGCRREKVPQVYKPSHAHAGYLHSLEQVGLSDSALGRDWISSADRALQETIKVTPPVEEVFYVDHAQAFATAYEFEVKRGQRIECMVIYSGREPARLFIDLFRKTSTTAQDWIRIASAKEETRELRFEPRIDGTYILRLQPELLRGGNFRVTIRQVAALEFPVAGRNSRAIQSRFGDSRDGGRRKHHGVDIFASRHTSVVAPSRAYVQHVGENDLGGRVIWLYDSKRSLYIYLAHLQTRDVKQNTWVDAGQSVGTVGNTGNARTTPPHLHFGLYSRGEGPIDPYNYIAEVDAKPAEIAAELDFLGQWVRIREKGITLRSAAAPRANPIAELELHTPCQIWAASGKQYRVLLPDERKGYIPASCVESLQEEILAHDIRETQLVRSRPLLDAPAVAQVNIGENCSILGEFQGFWFIRTQLGNRGWLPVVSTRPRT